MFQFLKKLGANKNLYVGNYMITKSKSSLDTSIYTCVSDNYVIHFECYHGDKLFNNFGESKILYKDTVISKEKHNLSLSNFTDSFKRKHFGQKASNLSSNDINYIKRYFKDAISYVKKINIKSLDIMLPFYKKKLLEHVRCLKVSPNPAYQYPCGFGSHMDTYDELYNDTSLHLLWNVDFKNKTTRLMVYIYNDDTFISEYSHSMNVEFDNDLLDINYYDDFFKALIDRLIHCYFPSRKLLELLESALDMTDFDGTLTEDEYYLFKMMNI